MTQDSQGTLPTFFPYFGYRDAGAALEWLINVFGFEKIAELKGPDETIMHAELRFGNGVIMLSSSSDPQERQTPAEHGIYVYVDDVDAHYERVKAAGAHIVFAPEDTGWGSRRYRVLDPEGYEWSFGTYRPSMTTDNA